MNKLKVKAGCLLSIPVGDLGYAVCIVLHISRYFKQAMMIGIYDTLFASFDQIEISQHLDHFIDVPNYVSIQVVKKNLWHVIGESDTLLSAAQIPILRVVNELFLKDEPLGKLPIEEALTYPEVSGQGSLFVEKKLQRYFRQKNTA